MLYQSSHFTIIITTCLLKIKEPLYRHRVVRSLLSSEGYDHENIMGGIIKRRVSRKHHKAAGRRRPPPPVQVGGHKDMSR